MKNHHCSAYAGLGAAGVLLVSIVPVGAAAQPVRHPLPYPREAPISGSLYSMPGYNNDLNALVGRDGRPNAAGAQYELNRTHSKDCAETSNFVSCL